MRDGERDKVCTGMMASLLDHLRDGPQVQGLETICGIWKDKAYAGLRVLRAGSAGSRPCQMAKGPGPNLPLRRFLPWQELIRCFE